MRINKTDLAKKIQMLLPDTDREVSILSNVVLFDCTERSNVQFDLSSEIVLLMQGSEIVEAGNSNDNSRLDSLLQKLMEMNEMKRQFARYLGDRIIDPTKL